MDLNEIAVFVKVVQVGSFKGAAQALGMPNSTVSAKVSALEKRLGVTLLHRTTRKLSTTEEGQKFFERGLAGVELLRDAEEQVTGSQGEAQGLLRITAAVSLGSSLLAPVAAEFLEKHPKIQLEFILTDRTVDLIGEGIDLAIRAGELKDSSFVAKKLGMTYFAPFASAGYLKVRGTPKHPKDLGQHTCVRFTPLGRDSWTLVNKTGARVKVSLNGGVATDDLAMARELALAGQGVALLPTFLCREDRERGKLKAVLSDWKSEVRPVNFVYPRHGFTPLKVAAFIDFATDPLRRRLE